MTAQARIDFAALADGADLAGLIASERGQADRHGKYLCPFHDDHNPSLGLTAGGRRFRCWACGEAGSALDWIMKREGVDVIEAARRLDPSIAPARGGSRPAAPRPAPTRRPTTPKPSNAGRWRDPAWQAAADELIRLGERTLWSAEGRDALDWLRARGFADHTIRRFRLGFLAEWFASEPLEVLAKNGELMPINAARGITIPWLAPGNWYALGGSVRKGGSAPVDEAGELLPRWVGVNVRRLRPDVFEPWSGADKCLAFAGSDRGYCYPHDDPTPGLPCLIAEGEPDALLAWQEVADLVAVVTTGGSGGPPRPEALAALDSSPAWLIATDYDEAGHKAAEQWRARAGGRGRRLLLPSGKDLGEFHQAGGDLREWVRSELHRLGLESYLPGYRRPGDRRDRPGIGLA